MNILITGAGGILGSELIAQLLKTDHRVFALSSNKEKVKSKFGEQCSVYNIAEWREEKLPLRKMDIVIHGAFPRAYKDGEDMAKGLIFSTEFLMDVAQKRVPALINISSQAVYGDIPSPWQEDGGQKPNSIYGIGKYYSELLVDKLASNAGLYSTNIRLASLVGIGADTRMVSKLIDNVLKGEPIKILGGKLIFSQLDVRDAASGIIVLLSIPGSTWENTYNLGYTRSYSIMDIATIVKTTGESYGKEVEIIIEDSDVIIEAELDSNAFYRDTGWVPKYDMEAIARSIFEYKLT